MNKQIISDRIKNILINFDTIAFDTDILNGKSLEDDNYLYALETLYRDYTLMYDLFDDIDALGINSKKHLEIEDFLLIADTLNKLYELEEVKKLGLRGYLEGEPAQTNN